MPSPTQIKQELKQTYDAMADDFSNSRSKAWPEFEWLEQFIPDGSSVLDLGCGNGRFYEFIARKQVDYTGVDFSRKLLELARHRYPEPEFIEQDITALDINKTFDRVVAVAAFHHIPGRGLRRKTLKLIFHHLKDDGLLLLSVWDLWQWKHARYFLVAVWSFLCSGFRSDPRDVYIPFGKDRMRRYYHAFLPTELRRLLNSCSFQVEEFKLARFNFLMVCRKNMLVATGNPLLAKGKKLAEGLRKSAPAVTCGHESRTS